MEHIESHTHTNQFVEFKLHLSLFVDNSGHGTHLLLFWEVLSKSA